MVKYHEFPLAGDWNSLYSPKLMDSPLYYYIAAGLVAIKDDILFLGLVNIFAQLASYTFCLSFRQAIVWTKGGPFGSLVINIQ